MHVLTRALVALIVIGAAAAVLVRRDEWGAAFSYAPEATLLVLGGVLGFLVAFSRRFSETPPDPPLSTLAPDATRSVELAHRSS